MNSTRTSRISLVAIAIAAFTFSLAVRAQAQTETVLYNFPGGSPGRFPVGGIVFDHAGNLYGTASSDGFANCNTACGVVFELSPTSGGWQQTVLHTFSGGYDGGGPRASLVFDAAGNLYGTTQYGGGSSACSNFGCGVVFELSPTTSGTWQETILHSFGGGKDGKQPLSSLVFDAAGNLYGTTSQGGSTGCSSNGCGTVFELSPTASGPWKETLLRSFLGGSDGANPYAAVTFDAAGNLYGTTFMGGTSNNGVAYRLSPVSGRWQETILYRFQGSPDGYYPQSNLIFDAAGNLYGTTEYGGTGANGRGVVFELSPTSGTAWKETRLRSLSNPIDGEYPLAALVFDAAGNLWGTTSSSAFSTGVVFELSPSSSGAWTQTTLPFTGTNGEKPLSGLVLDAAGNLYGTTELGGTGGTGYGVVFEITP